MIRGIGLAGLLLVAGCGAKTTTADPPAIAQAQSGTSRPAVAGAAPTTTAPAAAGDPGSPCPFATADEVTAAVGVPMTAGSGTPSDCPFASADGAQQLLIQELTDAKNMQVYLQTETAGEHIDGLGDDAFWIGMTETVFVRKGDRALVIGDAGLTDLHPGDLDGGKAGMVQLATSALAHL